MANKGWVPAHVWLRAELPITSEVVGKYFSKYHIMSRVVDRDAQIKQQCYSQATRARGLRGGRPGSSREKLRLSCLNVIVLTLGENGRVFFSFSLDSFEDKKINLGVER